MRNILRQGRKKQNKICQRKKPCQKSRMQKEMLKRQGKARKLRLQGSRGRKEKRSPCSVAQRIQNRKVQMGRQCQGKQAAQGEKEKPEEPKPQETASEAGLEETAPEEPKPEETAPEGPKPEETAPQEAAAQTAAPYDSASVCSQATAKCQAGGMVTTTDNLAGLLAEGKITKEEYNSYYPYDGLGYYSVFVETDLNKASTTSGRKLGSEEGIADYIASMMLLETEPVFFIEYAGTCSLNGTDFYEFRCYR